MKKKTLIDACQQYDFKKITEYLSNFHILNGKALVSETRHGIHIFKPAYCYDNWTDNYVQLMDILLSNKLILKMVKAKEHPFENLFFEMLQINQEKVLNTFLKYGIDINQKSSTGDNALLFCLNQSYYKMVPLLIEQGIDINYQNKNQYNALLLSILKEQENIADLLINNKINVNQEIAFINGRKKEYTNAIKLALDTHMFDIALNIIKQNDIHIALLEDTYFYLDNFSPQHIAHIRVVLEEKINVIYETETLHKHVCLDNVKIPRKMKI